MATANADGSIVLSVQVDTGDLQKGTKSLKSQAATLAAEYRKAGMSQSEAFKKAWSEIERTKKETDGAQKQTKKYGDQAQKSGAKAKSAFFEIGNALGRLALVAAAAFSFQKLIQFGKEASSLATQTEASVQRLIDIYGQASQAVGDFIDANALALGLSRSAAASYASIYGNLFSVWADQETNAALTMQYLQMTAVVASKTGRTVEDVQERIRSGLLGNTEAIEDLGVFVNVKTIEMTDAFQRMAAGKSWEQLDAYTQQQIRSMAILEQATEKYGNEVANTTALAESRFRAAWEDFQATWGQMINQVLVPILNILTDILITATRVMQTIFGLSGATISQSDAIANSTSNQKEFTDAVKETGKEAKKAFAGFDEINVLTQNLAENASDAAGNTSSNIEFPQVGSIPGVEYDGSIVEQISGDLAFLMEIIGGALAAVGVILLFTGNIAWGIGFIIAGAAALSVGIGTQKTTGLSQSITNELLVITTAVGEALVAIGIILIAFGSISWGIGFMTAGAGLFGASAAAIGNANAPDEVQKMISQLMLIIGPAFLAMGFILLAFGASLPLAIGLIALGAANIVGAAALNTEYVVELLRGKVGEIVAIASGALLALGIILLFTPASLGLAVSLIAAGAAGLATVAVINWDSIVETLRGRVWEIVAIASGAVLALGIILLFTPASIGLAVGLIAAGAAGLAGVMAINWDWIAETMRGKLGKIMAIVSASLLVLGLILLFVPAAQALGLGLIVAGALGLVSFFYFNWDWILESIKKVWDSIKQFWNTYISPVFTTEFWLDLAKTCGNGLIAGFEASVNAVIWLFESLVNFVVDALNAVTSGISTVTGAVGDLIGVDLRIPKIPQAYLGRVSIPRLAQGAVIPPNREFLAMLGDQKSGTNIEAPLETIVQAMRIALAESNASKGEAYMVIDEQVFGRLVYRYNNSERNRIGVSLAGGMA